MPQEESEGMMKPASLSFEYGSPAQGLRPNVWRYMTAQVFRDSIW
jgi:hypothetical protein